MNYSLPLYDVNSVSSQCSLFISQAAMETWERVENIKLQTFSKENHNFSCLFRNEYPGVPTVP